MKFCRNCGEVLEDKKAFCPNCGKKNKKSKNMLLYFITMIIIFIAFDFGSQLIYSGGYHLIRDSRFGAYFIIETIWAATVFVVMILAGNAYVFNRKKEPLWKSIILAVPPMFISVTYFLMFINKAYTFNSTDVGCLLLYCLAIGVTEEFMCRGWLLTEFIERYGYDRKHVRLSLICSSLVFSLMHLTNILAGQEVFETILQVIQTFGFGYLMGVIFYRTRNIWSVVIIHAVYDFSLMLTEISTFNACTYGEKTIPMMIMSIIVSSLFCFLYMAVAEVIFRKTKTNQLLPKPQELKDSDRIHDANKVKLLVTLSVIAFITIGFLPTFTPEDYETCSKYKHKTITDSYYLTSIKHAKEYKIDKDNISLTLIEDSENDGLYHLINNNTHDEIVLYKEAHLINLVINENYFAISSYNRDDKKIYYNKVAFSDIDDTKESLEKILDNTKEYISPTLNSFVILSYENRGEQYIAFTSEEMTLGVIESDEELYEVIEK